MVGYFLLIYGLLVFDLLIVCCHGKKELDLGLLFSP
jgi:hypothetical protein